MTIASLVSAGLGLLIVLVSLVRQLGLDPEDPKYSIGTGVAVTPPTKPVGGYLGAPKDATILHVTIPGAVRLVHDQGNLTKWAIVGSALQVVAVIFALLA